MLLNSHSYNFNFKLPNDFFTEDIKKKWDTIIKNKYHNNIRNCNDFINGTIQDIVFPPINTNNITQIQNGRHVTMPDGNRPSMDIDKKFIITFRNVDGFSNYFLMYETLLKYREYQERTRPISNMSSKYELWKGDFVIYYTSVDKHSIFKHTLQRIVFDGISELKLSFKDVNYSTKDFSCFFSYTYPIFEIMENNFKNSEVEKIGY